MSKHTKGPWKQHLVDETVIIDSRREQIAQACGDYPLNAVEIEANARLIAAAPDLLEALKHAVHWHDQLNAKDIAKMEAAIAKAEGNQ